MNPSPSRPAVPSSRYHCSAGVQIGGRVAKVFVDEGQFVKQGQILAELDLSDYKNAYDAAAGQAAAAAARALQAKNGPRPQELDEARIDFEHAQDEYTRMKYLYDIRAFPQMTFISSRRRIWHRSKFMTWHARAPGVKRSRQLLVRPKRPARK